MKEIIDIELDGVDSSDYPDFTDAYISAVQFIDGTFATDEQLDELQEQLSDDIHELAYEQVINSI